MHCFDQFGRDIKNELLSTIPLGVNFQSWYSNDCLDKNNYGQNSLPEHIRKIKVTCPNVILFHNDLLECGVEYNHDDKNFISAGAQAYIDLVNQHPNTNFVLVIARENASSELTHDRIQLVHFLSGMTNEKSQYQSLMPETSKNFDSDKTFVSLNRHARQHRINLVSYLLGRDLEKYGIISFRDNMVANSWLERVSWQLDQRQENEIKPALMLGYKKSKKLKLENTLNQVDMLYRESSFNNAMNFDISLRPMYRNCFIEIVPETSFNQPTFGASEKFLNSVYGCTFPILIGGCGLVNWLSDMGFDMFDDVIDHSYDQIKNPLDRLCAAIDLNIGLITDVDKVKKLWDQHRVRFELNVEFAKNKMYDWLRQRAIDEFQQVTWLKS